jgi:hypothetical protein
METTDFNLAAGWLFLRLTAGVLFFFQGYDKIFKVGVVQVVETFNEPFRQNPLPHFLLKPMVLLSSYAEMLGGLLLALGFLKDYAACVLAGDLAVVAFVFSSLKPMWDMQYYFPRFVMIVALLMIPNGSDHWALDYLL